MRENKEKIVRKVTELKTQRIEVKKNKLRIEMIARITEVENFQEDKVNKVVPKEIQEEIASWKKEYKSRGGKENR